MAENSLELEQHLSAQHKQSYFRKVLWVIIAIIIITACAGWLGGRGLWATANTTSDQGTFVVQYSKFDRMKAPSHLEITLAHVASNQAKVAINDQYLKATQVQQVNPQPDSVATAQGRTIYTFNTEPGSNLHIYFNLEYGNFGPLQAQVERLDTQDHVAIKQYVFP